MEDIQKINKQLGELPYLSPAKISEILEGFKKLGVMEFPDYSNAADFSKQIEQASNLKSEGVKYNVSTSTTKD